MTPRSHPRSARSEALWAGAGFVGLTLTFVAVMETRYPHWTDLEYAARRERVLARVAEEPDRPVLAVLGSSRVGTGFVPEALGEVRDPAGRPVCVFNFSHMGGGPRLNLLMLRRLLRDGVRPAWVLLELLPGQLHREDIFFTDLSLCDAGWLCPHWRDDRLPTRLARYRLDAPSRYRRTAVSELVPGFASGRPVTLGPCGGDEDWERPARMATDDGAALARIIANQYRDRLGRFQIDPTQDQIVRVTIEMCRAEGIQVAVVILPEDRTFRSWYGPGVEERIRAYAHGLRAGCRVPVFDTRDWMPDEAFNDPHHLTAQGAREYSVRLNREVIRPLLAGGPGPP